MIIDGDEARHLLFKYRSPEIGLVMGTKTPSNYFLFFDLGKGGYLPGPARDSKRLVKTKLRQAQKLRQSARGKSS